MKQMGGVKRNCNVGHTDLWFAETCSTSKKQRTYFNEPWQEASILNVFYMVCVLGRSENTVTLASDDWDSFTERNSKKLGRKQILNVLYMVCVLGRSENKDGYPGIWLTETVLTSLKPLALNGIRRNLAGSKY